MDWLWAIIIVVAIIWLLGLLLRIGGRLIHLALIAAIALLVVRLVTG
jgi:hypothetical protein